jgi:kinesin family protein 2/24
VNIIGLTIKKVSSTEEFMETISYGSSVRITSQNSTNSDSSRSHAIMQIDLKQGKKNAGKISFIDLAGC